MPAPASAPYYNLDPTLGKLLPDHLVDENQDEVRSKAPFEPYFQGLIEAATTAAALKDSVPSQTSSEPPVGSKRKSVASPSTVDSNNAKRQKTDAINLPQVNLENARDAGRMDILTPGIKSYHSSITLFRDPGTSSKKRTRPPMSDLFSSFHLDTATFLRLADAAKCFMLDPAHVERQNCLGIRGKSDARVVRFELSGYAHQFLEHEAGAAFFGISNVQSDPTSNVSESTPKPYVWPEDKARIVELCMPLLRRVVRNEQQRQYAQSTRKTNKSSQEKAETESPVADVVTTLTSVKDISDPMRLPAQIYVINNDSPHTVIRKAIVTPKPGPDAFWSCVLEVVDSPQEVALMSVHTSSGLAPVKDDEQYVAAVCSILDSPWMEGVVKVVVHIEKQQATVQ